MKGYVFDPSRLARSPEQQERDGYAVAGSLLRNYFVDDDIVDEVRERALRDRQVRAMLRYASELLREAAPTAPAALARRPRRPRGRR